MQRLPQHKAYTQQQEIKTYKFADLYVSSHSDTFKALVFHLFPQVAWDQDMKDHNQVVSLDKKGVVWFSIIIGFHNYLNIFKIWGITSQWLYFLRCENKIVVNDESYFNIRISSIIRKKKLYDLNAIQGRIYKIDMQLKPEAKQQKSAGRTTYRNL